ncbi:MAG: helix-turn-helix domain-containing protein [Oscillospiraceae bacterium]|jgi:transcriptional regulator with XRE-family HTH domain|nr:helix-turn-helix domain-containing protein [Oscillospiraceae bacterium]
MSIIAKTIGERLRAYRSRAGWSQEELAERAGLHSTYIGQLERGEKNATMESMEKVALALALPLEVLFENIVTGDAQNAAARACYDLVTALPEKEQTAILELLKKIVAYRNIA